MKHTYKAALFTAAVLGSLTSCQSSLDEVLAGESQLQTITVNVAQDIWQDGTTRGVTEDESTTTATVPAGPVHYYLCSGSSFVADQEVATASTSATFEVNLGSYTVYAVTGTTCSITSETASLSTPFAWNPATINADVCIGHKDITVTNTSSSQSATIDVDHMFTQIKMSITDVPGDVTGITTTISPVYDRFGWDGTLSQSNSTTPASTTLTLTKNSETTTTWESAMQYSYPSVSSTSALNITVTFNFGDNRSKTFRTTATTSLLAGHKRTLTTQYKKFDSSLSASTTLWSDDGDTGYELGDDVVETTVGTGGSTEVETPSSHAFGYKYADNIMVIGEYSSTQLLVMYTTPVQYYKATTTLNSLNQGETIKWNIPTADQWEAIVTNSADKLYEKVHSINNAVTENDISSSTYYVAGKDNLFYYYQYNIKYDDYEEDDLNEALFFPVKLVTID
jgi:hypothetical protein